MSQLLDGGHRLLIAIAGRSPGGVKAAIVNVGKPACV
jgi:hypothetical protein